MGYKWRKGQTPDWQVDINPESLIEEASANNRQAMSARTMTPPQNSGEGLGNIVGALFKVGKFAAGKFGGAGLPIGGKEENKDQLDPYEEEKRDIKKRRG